MFGWYKDNFDIEQKMCISTIMCVIVSKQKHLAKSGNIDIKN